MRLLFFVIGNRIVLEDEKRKLRLLVETARAVWD